MAKKRKRPRPIPDFGYPPVEAWDNPFFKTVAKALDVIQDIVKQSAPAAPWRAVLGFTPEEVVTAEDVERRFKARAKIMHPDAGGSHNEMVLLNQAKEEALKACQ